MQEKMRCFIALDLPREVINEIKKIQEQIKKKNLFTGKVTEPENLHLTLKFLGEISEEKIEKVKTKLKEIKLDEFEVSLGECGTFSKKFIGLIWVKLESKILWELQKEIDEKLKDMFDKEARFMSHVTIARVKSVPDRKALVEYVKNLRSKTLGFKVLEFFLKKSELRSEGPVYEDIEKYRLRS